MRGALVISRQQTPYITAVATAVETKLGNASWLIDPSFLDLTHDLNVRFGGQFTGTGTVTFRIRVGGSFNVADGAVLFTSTAITPPGSGFVVEAGMMPPVAVLTRVKMTYTCTGNFQINDFFFMFY